MDTPQRKPSSALYVFLLTALISAVCFVLTAMYRYIVLLIAALVLGFGGLLLDRHLAKKGKNLKKSMNARIIVLIMCMIPVLAVPPLTVESRFRWQYPFQKYIINRYRNLREPDWFPEIDGDAVVSGYRFSYLPSIMQGTGHYSIAFNTTAEQMEQYAEEYGQKKNAVKMLGECRDAGPDARNTDTPSLWLDPQIRQEAPKKSSVFIIDAQYDFNHPHTSAIIMDMEHKRIQFLQLG